MARAAGPIAPDANALRIMLQLVIDISRRFNLHFAGNRSPIGAVGSHLPSDVVPGLDLCSEMSNTGNILRGVFQ